MPDDVPTLGVPTLWRQMAYCIVAAFEHIIATGRGDQRDNFYPSELKVTIGEVFHTGGRSVDWGSRSTYGRAFDLAMNKLVKKGVVVGDEIDGYRPVKWGPQSPGKEG